MDIPTTSETAIYRLQNYLQRLPLSRFQALEILEAKLNVYQLLHLYQVFFPKQFAASRASTLPIGQGYSQRERELLDLLYEHCFPLPEWAMEWAYEQRLEYIPIEDRGISWQCEDSIEGLVDEWKILIPLSSEGYYWLTSIDRDLAEWYELEFGISIQTIQASEQVPQDLLRKRCLQAGTPFKFLPLVLRVLDKNTGNVWLDEQCSYCYGSDYSSKYPWTEASIRFLTKEWQRALKTIECCNEFTNWLGQDLQAHFNLVLELWNQPYPVTN